MNNDTTPGDVKEPEGASQPAPQIEPKPEKRSPLEYVEEAHLLLAYAAEQGLEIEQEFVAIIVNARDELERDAWTTEREIQFWMVFDDLARLVHPVSIDSLKATRKFGGYGAEKGKKSHLFSQAEGVIRRYQLLTFLILVILLTIQIYWMVGSAIIEAVNNKIPAALKELDVKIAEMTEKIDKAKQDDNEEAATPAKASRNKFTDEYQNLEAGRNSYYEGLRAWTQVLCVVSVGFIFCDDESEENYAQKGYIETRQAAQLILQPIELYFLPILYGSLGACAFILRNISREVRDLTYTPDSAIRYRLRMQLGPLAGLAVGWFLFVPSDTSTGDAFLSLRRISPFALAFLAGYSVELFFTAMDKMVEAFSSGETSPKKKPKCK